MSSPRGHLVGKLRKSWSDVPKDRHETGETPDAGWNTARPEAVESNHVHIQYHAVTYGNPRSDERPDAR